MTFRSRAFVLAVVMVLSSGFSSAGAQVPSHPANGCVRTSPSGRVVIPRCPHAAHTVGGAHTAALATITVGSNPSGIAVNPLTNTIYVANTGDNTLSIINGKTNATTTIPIPGTFPFPSGVAVNPLTGRVYVANNIDQTVTVLTATGVVVTTINISPSSPQGIAVNPATNKIYVPSGCGCSGNTVTVIDGNTNSIVHVITVGNGPEAVAINPLTNRVYVPNSSDGTVSVINGSTDLVIGSAIPVSSDPTSDLEGIAVNTVTNTIYVTDLNLGTLTAINGATNNAGPPLPVGFGTFGIAVDAATNIAYVVDSPGNQLYAVNGTTSSTTQVSGPSDLDGPYGVDVNPNTGLLYVTNASSNYVSVYSGIAGPSAMVPTETCSSSPQVGGTATCVITLTSPLPVGGSATKTITSPSGATITGCSAAAGGLTCASGSGTASITLTCTSLAGACQPGAGFSVTISGLPSGTLSQTIAITPPGGGTPVSFALNQTVSTVVGAGTTVTSSANPSTVGQSITFTATVACPGSTPTGTVTFSDAAAALATVALSGGQATFTTSALSAGSHPITASYSGDGTCAASASTVLTQVVSPLGVPADGAPPVATSYCAPAVNAPPPGVPCLPVPVTSQQGAAAVIAFCMAAYSDLPAQQTCIASMIPNVGGFISPFGGSGLGTIQPKKPAPPPPGRYCSKSDGSQVWVVAGAPLPDGARC